MRTLILFGRDAASAAPLNSAASAAPVQGQELGW